MNKSEERIQDYLTYCKEQKCLDEKTLKAYRVDLRQLAGAFPEQDIAMLLPADLESYIAGLHQRFKPKTVKRKIASIKAMFHYLEYREVIAKNPFARIQVKFREPVILPRTIPLHTVETLLTVIYRQISEASTPHQRKDALCDAAVVETLFATGIRISELCSLGVNDICLYDGTVLIYGKGAKERRIQIGINEVLRTLKTYKAAYTKQMESCGHFFADQLGHALSDQAIRRMLNKYTDLASIELHITPHMFRHTFATSLLEADVDIRYIQEMLGHSSISITEIYTHVATAKQRDILTNKHPRKEFHVTRIE